MTSAIDKQPAVVLCEGAFRTPNGKTSHGLVRFTNRFDVVGLVDSTCAGQDAGELLDGKRRGIPIFASLRAALEGGRRRPTACVVGTATHGGWFTDGLRKQLVEAATLGLSIVNGLHDYAAEDPDIAAAARATGVSITDLRRPRPKRELHFFHGDINNVRAARIAVLGTDCNMGKRTTARLLVEGLNAAGTRAEMIYTGQTGWMQGGRYGFILDSVVNDFVSGELEHAVVSCDKEARPDAIVIEGQSALRNPCGPCGSELLLSAGARAVVLQHAPARELFEGIEHVGARIPRVEDEIDLIAKYGSRVIAVALNEENMDDAAAVAEQKRLRALLGIPVVRPLRDDGVAELVAAATAYVAEQRR